MSDQYWELDDLANSIAKAHFVMINQRRVNENGEYYGSHDGDPFSQITLTYNIIEAIHSLGFPLDSPRLSKALNWLKKTAFTLGIKNNLKPDNAGATIAKLFLLKSFQYMPGFEQLYSVELGNIPSFIRRNLNNDEAKMLPYMALDSVLFNNKKYRDILEEILLEIENRLPACENSIIELSYTFYLSSHYIKKGFTLINLPKIQEASANKLAKRLNKLQGNYFQEFYGSCYCLLNIGRIERDTLKSFNLLDDFIMLREQVKNYFISYLEDIFNSGMFLPKNLELKQCYREGLPKEIKNLSDEDIHLYAISILMRSLAKTSDHTKELQIAVAHSQLKTIYEVFYDPLKYEFARLRYLSIGLIIFIIFYFLYQFFPLMIGYLTGHKVSANFKKYTDIIFGFASGLAGLSTIFVVIKNQFKSIISKYRSEKGTR